jgi:hypothetical protein
MTMVPPAVIETGGSIWQLDLKTGQMVKSAVFELPAPAPAGAYRAVFCCLKEAVGTIVRDEHLAIWYSPDNFNPRSRNRTLHFIEAKSHAA